MIPLERLKVLTQLPSNKRSEGFWNEGPEGCFRVVNNTSACIPPALAIYRSNPPLEARDTWAAVPPKWIENGCVRFCVAKGTLVPAASLRGGNIYGSQQKRQRRSQAQAQAAPPMLGGGEPSHGSAFSSMGSSTESLEPHSPSAELEAEAAGLRAEIAQDIGAVPSVAVAIAAASGPPSDAATRGASSAASSSMTTDVLLSSGAGGRGGPPRGPFGGPTGSAGMGHLAGTTVAPGALVPALSGVFGQVEQLLGAALRGEVQGAGAALSAPQRRFLEAQRRRCEESLLALSHWEQPEQLDAYAASHAATATAATARAAAAATGAGRTSFGSSGFGLCGGSSLDGTRNSFPEAVTVEEVMVLTERYSGMSSIPDDDMRTSIPGGGDGAPWEGLDAMEPLEPQPVQPHAHAQPPHPPLHAQQPPHAQPVPAPTHWSRMSLGAFSSRMSMGPPQPRLTRKALGEAGRGKTHAGRMASEHSQRRPSMMPQRPGLERRHSDSSVLEPETRMATLRHALMRMFRDPQKSPASRQPPMAPGDRHTIPMANGIAEMSRRASEESLQGAPPAPTAPPRKLPTWRTRNK